MAVSDVKRDLRIHRGRHVTVHRIHDVHVGLRVFHPDEHGVPLPEFVRALGGEPQHPARSRTRRPRSAASALGLGSPPPHLRRGLAHPRPHPRWDSRAGDPIIAEAFFILGNKNHDNTIEIDELNTIWQIFSDREERKHKSPLHFLHHSMKTAVQSRMPVTTGSKTGDDRSLRRLSTYTARRKLLEQTEHELFDLAKESIDLLSLALEPHALRAWLLAPERTNKEMGASLHFSMPAACLASARMWSLRRFALTGRSRGRICPGSLLPQDLAASVFV